MRTMKEMNYGVIGNCQSAALISENGSIDWLCFPRFDSPSIFSKLLDREKGGSFAIIVSDNYKSEQKYFRATNILCTRFTSDEGCFEVFDFMPRYRTINNEHHAPAEVCRYIRLVSGTPRFKVKFDPVMNYAREAVVHREFPDYIRTFSKVDGDNNLYLYSSLDHGLLLDCSEITLEKEEFLLLSYNQKLESVDINRIYLEYQRTKVYWLNWNNRSHRFAQYDQVISRSLLVLKLMCYEPSGAVLAALTTSLPETIGEVRNWDYRFCWIRDASMSIETLFNMGHQFTARRFMSFIKKLLTSKADFFQIMYGIDGSRVLHEETLPHLAGYENSRPVRIGNAAYNQRQNDIYGYLMDIIKCYFFHFPGTLGELEEMWEIVRTVVKNVYRVWKKPDQGIWEFRNSERHFVFSKVMCWVALDRAVEIAQLLKQTDYEAAWQKEADGIKADVFQKGWNTKIESFTQAYDNTAMDSSLLLMEQYGFIDARDERFIKTMKRIKQELYCSGLMFRYKNKDDFGQPTSAFTICSFWLIRALYVTGEKEEACKIFKEILSCANHVGLFSEDLDFKTKRLLGNFPQAYSHLALINTAQLFTECRITTSFIRP